MSMPPLPVAMLRRAIVRLSAQREGDAIKAEAARCLEEFRGWTRQHAPDLADDVLTAHAQGAVIAVLYSTLDRLR